MNLYLDRYEMTEIDSTLLCNYCGEEAVVHASYDIHYNEWDTYYKCSCEGARWSSGLKSNISNLKSYLEGLEKDFNFHINQEVHPYIKNKLFEKEMKSVYDKYGMAPKQ